ncbi:response regulator [Catenovulum sp. SX2]|uniref:response regulator n=1 Tax=Catenovulum sp. SX2 TaxID=3398614 RepID=UPI003F86577D
MSKQYKIICVDDDDINLTILESLLAEFYPVRLFNSAQSLLDTVDLTQDNFADLIILDVQMPGMDGYQLCSEIRKVCPDIPILFLSGYTELADRLKGFEAGGDDYLHKPFDPEEILYKITTNLERIDKLNSMQSELKSTQDIAFTSMVNAGELGQVIQFIQSTYQAKSYRELAGMLARCLESYDLSAVFCFRYQQQQEFFATHEKIPTNLEKDLTSKQGIKSKLVTIGLRCIASTEHLTILIKNLPADEDKQGRLRDHLAMILDSCDHCIKYLTAQQIQQQSYQQVLASIGEKAQQILTKIDHVSAQTREAGRSNVDELKNELTSLEIKLDLDEASISEIHSLADSLEEGLAIFDNGMQEIDYLVNSLFVDMNKVD